MTTKHRIIHLEGLRGLAILSVVLFHAYARWINIEPWPPNAFLKLAFANGWLGVQLFFVLSGFLICASLDQTRDLTQFVSKRWQRLFPAMLMASVFLYVTALHMPYRPSGVPVPKDLVAGLTFIDPVILEKIFGGEFRSMDGSFWSLYIEIKFYALMGLCYFLLKDKKSVCISALYGAYLLLVLIGPAGVAKLPALNGLLKALKFLSVDFFLGFW